jgi:hypothetical protein
MARLCKTIRMLASCPDTSWRVIGYADIIQILKILFDPYQPELHYMRGPGPKWHAKHG